MTRSQSAGSESTNGLALSQPALLTSTSMWPNCRCTWATIASTDSREVTSAQIPTAPIPTPFTASAVSLAVASLRSVTTTVAPSAASFSAMPRPMPCPAPVTIATLLSSFPIVFSILMGRAPGRASAGR